MCILTAVDNMLCAISDKKLSEGMFLSPFWSLRMSLDRELSSKGL